ncbi:actin cortical patch SUR7/pH-response regulator pali [Mycena amicta]|nr:actin cortical patch SUR7/pH-response regulator pali [Mycena amicta]
MRGEFCVGLSSFLALASLLLLLFVHVGQINTSSVPHGISLVKINMSHYGDGLHAAFIDDIDHLFTNNSSAPLQASAGLRQLYEFGLYSHCAYVNSSAGICTNTSIQQEFRPYDALTSDMLANYTDFTNFIFSGTTFADSDSLGHSSRAAYWMLLLGTICAAVALLTGVAKYSFTFFISTAFSILGSIFILIGASIWTTLIKRAETVNSIMISAATPVSVGIEVTAGSGLFLMWAAFASLFVSVVPYMISCCTFRG